MYKSLLFFFLLLLTFLFILILNIYTPLFADDWCYMLIFKSENHVRITNLYDIVISQYKHYFTWGGRSVVHFIDQYLLMLSSVSRAIIKSIVFTLFVYLLYKISNIGLRKYNYKLFIPALCLVFLSFPTFEETMLWTTGTANYLFGTTFILLFIYPFCLFFITKKNECRPTWYNFYQFFFGILAGWTNENSVPPVLLFILLQICFLFYKKKIVVKWMIYGYIGLLIGFLIMILAPGNYLRVGKEILNQGYIHFSSSEIWIQKFKNLVFVYTFYPYRIFSLILMYLLTFIFLTIKKGINKRMYYFSLIFFIAGNLSSILMIFSPLYPLRATFSMVTYIIIAELILLREVYSISKFYNKFIIFVSFILVLLFSYRYYQFYNDAKLLSEAVKKREKIISQNIAKGNLDIVLESGQIPKSKYYIDFFKDPEHWINRSYCYAYGLKSIRIE